MPAHGTGMVALFDQKGGSRSSEWWLKMVRIVHKSHRTIELHRELHLLCTIMFPM